ncbi:YcaO-like family protein [Streptomyces sp. NPDC058459]|uniref:YcaO-like family protein n=1 Tax=Streptomyces sp. NPDC058459 TaxID=3346508 RepID=UPI003647FD1D
MSPSSLAVAEAYRAAVAPGCGIPFDMGPADRLGRPAISVEHTDSTLPTPLRRNGCGYGADEDAALLGALGELAEGVLLTRHLTTAARVHGSYRELVAERGADRVADPVSLVLEAGSGHRPDQPLTWVAAERIRTGEEVLVPLEFALCDGRTADPPPGTGWLITPVTNGLGAGDTRARALAHGLLELIQRDGNATAHRAMDRGVVIDTDAARDPVSRAVLADLDAAGVRVVVKLADDQFRMAGLHVVGVDSDPDASPLLLTACGEAAHPDRETALRKALLEYTNSRARKVFSHGPLELAERLAPAGYLDRELSVPVAPQEPRALAAMTAWTRLSAPALAALLAPTVFAERSSVPFSALPTVPPGSLTDPEALLAELLDRLAEFDVLAVMAHGDGVHAVKVLVPGLEVETMSYHRIGGRGVRRLLERGLGLAGPGAPPHRGALPVLLTEREAELLGGAAWFDTALADRMVGDLYPLYREPDRHAVVRVSEGR